MATDEGYPLIFSDRALDHGDRVVWLFLFLFGAQDIEVIASTIATNSGECETALERLIASHYVDRSEENPNVYGISAVCVEFAESILGSPDLIIKSPIYSFIRGLWTSPVKTVDNPVDNPVDIVPFSDGLKGSSSTSSDSLNGQNDEEKKKQAKKKIGRPRGARKTTDSDFDSFWSEYPRDVAKKQALDQFVKIKAKAGEGWPGLLAEIKAGLAYAKRTSQWQKDYGAFIPHAFRWLRDERWRDRNVLAFGSYDVSSPAGTTVFVPTRRGIETITQATIEVIKLRLDKQSQNHMLVDKILLDPADLEIIARVPFLRLYLRSFERQNQYAFYSAAETLEKIRARPTSWRIGREPSTNEDWETELLLRDAESVAIQGLMQ